MFIEFLGIIYTLNYSICSKNFSSSSVEVRYHFIVIHKTLIFSSFGYLRTRKSDYQELYPRLMDVAIWYLSCLVVNPTTASLTCFLFSTSKILFSYYIFGKPLHHFWFHLIWKPVTAYSLSKSLQNGAKWLTVR